MAETFKVVVFTPVFGRHEIVKLWAMGVDRIMNFCEQVEIKPFCMVSNTEDEELIKGLGIDYVYCDNLPLGNKHNEGLKAIRDWDFDYILQLGSDDLVADFYIPFALYAMEQGLDLFGVDSLYFAHLDTKRACKFEITTQASKLIGAGRFISRKALELVDFNLWPSDINQGLDMSSQAKLQSRGVESIVLNIPEICVLDMKSDVNIWSYDRFGDFYPKVPYHTAIKNFPEL